MGHIIHKALVLLSVIVLVQVKPSYRQDIYQSYINDRMYEWKVITERIRDEKDKSPDRILELVNYHYGYIGYCITFDRREDARKCLELAEEDIRVLEKLKFRLSDIYAYKSAFCGFRMEINPLTVPYYGLKSIKYAKLALDLDSNNYMAHIQNGFVYCNMPASTGGSVQKGLTYYLKARELLESDPEAIAENWNYLSLLTVIAQSYASLNDYSSACDIYKHILDIEPGFKYVRDDLYPQLLKKLK
jgi:tetratricopeptide (TPR) repeat protein